MFERDGTIDSDNIVSLMNRTDKLEAEFRGWYEDYMLESPEERAESIFSWMDENKDGHLTEEEFVQYCLKDETLTNMLNAHGMAS